MSSFNCPHCDKSLTVYATNMVPKRSPSPVQPGNLNKQVNELLQQIYDGVMMGTALDNAAQDFVEKTKGRMERCEEAGWEIRMSDNQMNFLRSLAAKAGVD